MPVDDLEMAIRLYLNIVCNDLDLARLFIANEIGED